MAANQALEAFTGVMPDVSRALRRGDPWAALELLEKADIPEPGRLLLALIRTEHGWAERVRAHLKKETKRWLAEH